MELTPENKTHIDAMSYESLLQQWRYAPLGNPWFQGETDRHWSKRMAKLRSRPGGHAEAVRASKSMGWDGP